MVTGAAEFPKLQIVPSGTPLSGTAPGISGSALTLRRWKSDSGSVIVSRSRPRTCISAVMRWYRQDVDLDPRDGRADPRPLIGTSDFGG